MEKRYYTAETLEAELREFEQRFGLSSADFYELYVHNDPPASVPGHDRFVWTDLYREVCRMRGRLTDRAALQPAS